MSYDFNKLKSKIEDVKNWLAGELNTVRTGRATPIILDKVLVDSYGTMMPINNLANVGVEDARTLRISPWDMSQAPAIEKAIIKADIGLSVTVDDKGLRAIFPEMTGENREKMVKVVKQKLEDARVSLRKEREDVWENIQKQEKEGDINEDEKFRYKEEMQKIIDQANKSLEEMADKKEKEILN